MNSDASTPHTRNRALNILATAAVLGILYLGRDVFIPLTLAVILSFLIAPMVRRLRRLGLGHVPSVIAAVLIFAIVFSAGATVIGAQLVRLTASFQQYEQTIRSKVAILNKLGAEPLHSLIGPADRVINEIKNEKPASAMEGGTIGAATGPIAVEVREPPTSPLQMIERVISSVWGPLEMASIVLITLLFVLMERENLRDRFIRIVGGSDVRTMTAALNDAGEKLSKFFANQFAVNAGVGGIIWIGMLLIGLPYAFVWGALAAVMRFVPYVGYWIAGLTAVVLAAAVDPGWSLALMTFSVFALVETVAGQIVEPQLYGHTTGLSPLSVVIAALFWSWLWGPLGLVLSTPLTLCLLVAGRYFEPLRMLDVLLSDAQALTMPQRFYQRALSADADEIIARARDFLKGNSFAAFCESVLMPAVHLANLDLAAGTITREQLVNLRTTVIDVITALSGDARKFPPRRRRTSLLEDINAGQWLRAQREQQAGKRQKPLKVADGSVVVCIGLGSMADDLAAELLVRILRDQQLNARHLLLDGIANPPPAGASTQSVAIVYLVSAFPSEEREGADDIALDVRRQFGNPCIVTVFLPGISPQSEFPTRTPGNADKAALSFSDALQIALDWYHQTGLASK